MSIKSKPLTRLQYNIIVIAVFVPAVVTLAVLVVRPLRVGNE